MKSIIIFFQFLILCSSLQGATRTVTADDITYITEDYPPYSFIADGRIQGIAMDILDLMLQKMKATKGVKGVQIYPWARGYKTALYAPNTCLFTMTFTAERAKLFKLVGPIPKFDSAALFAKKSRKIQIRSYADLKPYKIGVVRDDIAHVKLVENGIKNNLFLLSGIDSLARMLASDRIDLWAFGELSVPAILRSNQVNPNDFENVFRLKTGNSYFAFNLKTPNALIQQFQKAFHELEKEKKIDAVVRRYIKVPSLKLN